MVERFLGRIGPVKQLQVLWRDRSGVNQRLKINYPVPIVLAIDHDADALGELFGLRQSQQLEEFVEGAEPAGKNHQCLGQIGEPQLPHEEVVKLEIQLRGDVVVGRLLKG